MKTLINHSIRSMGQNLSHLGDFVSTRLGGSSYSSRLSWSEDGARGGRAGVKKMGGTEVTLK